MIDTIVGESIEMDVNLSCFAVPVKKSCSEPGKVTHCGCGEDFKMIVDSRESIAPYSETKADTCQASLSDRLTPSLISAGLVCGIIPLCMRDASGQLTLDSVLRPQDGEHAEKQREDS